MEIRFQRVLLMLYKSLLIAGLASISLVSVSAESVISGVQPNLERKTVFDDVLDTENVDIGVQYGLLSIEDFESSSLLSVHSAFHINEYFYLKGRYAIGEAGYSSFEKLSNTSPLLTDEQRKVTYFGLNIGYNLMPGEIFIGKGLAFNSVLSVELGGGTTEFAGEDKFTVNATTNFRVFLNDWLSWDISVTDYVFETQITGETKTSHNLNVNTGLAIFF